MGKGDHIVIPKAILKRFLSLNNKISILDLETNKKDEKFPDEIYTQLHYYDEEVDKFIKDKCETIIGKLYSGLIKSEKYYKERNVELMKYIFIIQHFRTTSFINTIHNKKIHNKILLELFNFLENENVVDVDSNTKEIVDYIENLYKTFTPRFYIIRKYQKKINYTIFTICFYKFF